MAYTIPLGAKGHLALVSTKGSPSICLGQDSSRRSYLRDSTNVADHFENLASHINKLRKDDKDQLMSSLQYHRIALAASTDEVRLVNLWIALECFARGTMASIIRAICTYIPPSVAINDPYKILKGLCINIQRILPFVNKEKLAIISKSGTDNIIQPVELLSIFLDKEGGAKIETFHQIFSDHPLMIYRIWRLREKMFKNTKTLRRSLESHKQNIEWQLRRIYRARNHVNHRGSCKPDTSQLIQHLHTYLVTSLHNLIYDLNKNENWSISQVLEHRYSLFEYFIELLNGDENNPVSFNTLLNQSMLLGPQKEPFAWQNGKKGNS